MFSKFLSSGKSKKEEQRAFNSIFNLVFI